MMNKMLVVIEEIRQLENLKYSTIDEYNRWVVDSDIDLPYIFNKTSRKYK